MDVIGGTMIFNTKVRYGLAVVFALANKANYVSIQTIASELGLSKTYLEQVFTLLKNNQIVESIKGPQGGYRLIGLNQLDVYTVFKALDPDLIAYEDELALSDKHLNLLISTSIYRPLHETMIEHLKQLKIKELLLKHDDPMYFI
jgi:Rrf2 family protein